MKKIFSFFSLIIIVLSFSSCGKKIVMVGTNWYYFQEYSVAKYMGMTEEETANLGFSGKLNLEYTLNFFTESDAKIKIKLRGEIFRQIDEDSPKISYKKVGEFDEFLLTYTYKQPNGVLASPKTSVYWQQTVKFTISENAVFLTLEIDNQNVIFEFFPVIL